MVSEVRDSMVDGAMALLAQRGLQAASFSELLQATGAPRGSLYHHFPGGKTQLMGEAVERAGAMLSAALGQAAGQPADAVVERFLAIWRTVLTRSGCGAGCAVLAVTVASDADELLQRAATVFRAWRERLTDLLQQGGLPPDTARRLATTLIAATEGAVVLSRAERSLEPFDEVAAQLRSQMQALRPQAADAAPGGSPTALG